MYSCGHWDNPACMGESRRRHLAGRQQSHMRYGKHWGHHRGLRPGHVFMGVTWELGRSRCFPCVTITRLKGAGQPMRRNPGAVKGRSNLTSERKQRSKQGIGGG